jgi:hypothetical protein
MEEEEMEVAELEIDDNISNFGGTDMGGGESNKCIGGRWELKRRK